MSLAGLKRDSGMFQGTCRLVRSSSNHTKRNYRDGGKEGETNKGVREATQDDGGKPSIDVFIL